MEMEWEPRASDLFRRLLLQLDRRRRDDHEVRAREAAETHARVHGLRTVNSDAATIGFVKAASTFDKSDVRNALRRLGVSVEQYDDFF